MEEEKHEQKKTEKRKPNTDERNIRQAKQKERDTDICSEDESNFRFTTPTAEPFDQVRSQQQATDRELEQGKESVECDKGRREPEAENGETVGVE